MADGAGYLLDTNILVALIRGTAVGQTIDAAYDLRANLSRSMISVVTVGEIHALGRKLGWGASKLAALQSLIDDLVWIDVSRPEVLQAYAEIDHFNEKVMRPARPMAQNDIWIAATAKATGVTLLTTDSDFDHLDPQHITRIRIDPNTGDRA